MYRIVISLFVLSAWLVLTDHSVGQDSVFRLRSAGGSSKVNGKITKVTPNGVTVNGREVPAGEIRRLSFSKEPSEVNRARENMRSGRFADALEELGKISDRIRSKDVQAEVDFIKAFSTAQISLRGGNVTPQAAGAEIRNFMSTHEQSLHLYPAIEQYGKLIFAFGKPDLAVKEFEKIAGCDWLEYRLKGNYLKGMMHLELGQNDQAAAAFQKIGSEASNDDIAQTYKQLAACGMARVSAAKGDVESAKSKLEKMVQDENSENEILFANLYNALGAVYKKAGKTKESTMAYLKTDLLYATEMEAHAESLYHLALLWPQLEKTDRAARARETLKTRYRNSYWAGKL